MNNIKITDLPELSSITSDDLLIIVDSGNPYVTKKIAWKNIGVPSGAITDAPSGTITYGRRNNEWVDLTAPANLQIRRGTQSEVSGIIPLQGEPVWATDSKKLYIGDGSTYGGVFVGPRPPKVIQSFAQFNSSTIPIDPLFPPDIIRITSFGSGPITVGGITAPTSGCYEITVSSLDSTAVGLTLTIKHQLSTLINGYIPPPPSGNRIITPNGLDYVVNPGYSVRLYYDTVVLRWRII